MLDMVAVSLWDMIFFLICFYFYFLIIYFYLIIKLKDRNNEITAKVDRRATKYMVIDMQPCLISSMQSSPIRGSVFQTICSYKNNLAQRQWNLCIASAVAKLQKHPRIATTTGCTIIGMPSS